MKLLEDIRLQNQTRELTDAICGTQRVINGQIQCFSCKRAGTDKKYAHALDERYTIEVKCEKSLMPTSSSFSLSSTKAKSQSRQKHRVTPENSPYAKSPLGDFHESSVRRLMADLVLTLNLTFPDYDFGDIRPDHFRRILNYKTAVRRVNERLSELAQSKYPQFLNNLWSDIDAVISLRKCEVYSFHLEDQGGDVAADPFVTHTPPAENDIFDVYLGEKEDDDIGTLLWSFNYLFVNKHMKRILFFTCVQSCLKEDPTQEEEDLAGEFYYGNHTPSMLGEADSMYDCIDVEDEDEGFEGFVMDVDAVDEPAVSVSNA